MTIRHRGTTEGGMKDGEEFVVTIGKNRFKEKDKKMIEVKNVSKDFVSAKKYPGLKGAIKGLFSNEKVCKKAVEDVSFHIKKGEIVGYIVVDFPAPLLPI